MGDLEIYSSQGQLLYPGSQQTDRDVVGFSWKVFEHNTNANRPHLEAYSQMIIGGEQKQVFVRFYYDKKHSKFTEFHKTVKTEIQQGRGWTIPEPGEFDRARPFWELVVANDVSPQDTAEEMLRKYDPINENYYEVKQWLQDDSAPSLQLIAPHRYGGGLFKVLCELDVSTLVTNRDRFIGTGDIEIRLRKSGKNIKLSDKSEDYLDSVVEKRRKSKRESQYAKLTEALKNLNELNTPQQEVSSKLDSAFKNTFPELKISKRNTLSQGRQSRSRAQGGTRSRAANAGNDEPRTDSSRGAKTSSKSKSGTGESRHRGTESGLGSSGRSSKFGISPRTLLSVILVLALGATFVVAIVYVTSPGILLGGQNTADFSTIINGGENVEVTVTGGGGNQFTVEVYGGPTDSTPLNQTVVGSGSTESFDLSPGTYTVVVYANSNQEQTDEQEVIVKGATPTATAPTPTPTSNAGNFSTEITGRSGINVTIDGKQGSGYTIEIYEGVNTTGQPILNETTTPAETPTSYDVGSGEYTVLIYPATTRTAERMVVVNETEPTATPTTNNRIPVSI